MKSHKDNFTDLDKTFMQRALTLAQLGLFTAHPNPRVGCVIVKDQKIVGEGFHRRKGEAHAETNALKQAGEMARDATAYLTLEPCAHQGATGPCVNALIAAKLKCVIIATLDPNPLVYGKGLKALREAGIIVKVGLLAQ